MAISTFGINRIQDTDGLYILEYYPSTDASGASISAIKTSNSDIWDLVKEIRPQSETQEKIVLTSNAMVLKKAPELTTIDLGGFNLDNTNFVSETSTRYAWEKTPKLQYIKNFNYVIPDKKDGYSWPFYKCSSSNYTLTFINFYVNGFARGMLGGMEAYGIKFINSTLDLSRFSTKSNNLDGFIDGNCYEMDFTGLSIKGNPCAIRTDYGWFANNPNLQLLKGFKVPDGIRYSYEGYGVRVFTNSSDGKDLVIQDCDFSVAKSYGSFNGLFYGCLAKTLTLINTPLFTTRVNELFELWNCTTIYSTMDYYKKGDTTSSAFRNMNQLVGGAGSAFSKYGGSFKYAIIDGGEDNPGFLTKYVYTGYKLKVVIDPVGAISLVKTEIDEENLTWKAYFTDLKEGSELKQYVFETPNGQQGIKSAWGIDPETGYYLIEGNLIDGETGEYTLTLYMETPDKFVLTVNSQGQGIATGGGEYKAGVVVDCVATPNDGYIFKGWYKEISTTQTSTLVSTSKIYKFRILEDTVLTAVFATNPYSPGGDSGTGGGDGSFDDTSDNPTSDNTTPSIPCSMMSIFVPTDTQFEELGNYLYGESAKGFFTNLVDTIGSLGTVKVSDYTINCYQCPVAITADGSKALELGWYPTSLTMNYTNKMGVVVSLGTVEVPNYYGNALDYKSRIQIYLPYIGYQDLDPAEVIGKTLNLSYKIEFITGDCVATITIDNKPMYQFKGNVAYRIPLSQDNFSDVIQQGISIGANAIGAGIAVGSAMTPLRTGTSMYNWAIEQANQGVIYPAQLETGSQLMNEGVENLPTAQMSLEQLQNKLSTAINTGTNVPHGSSAGGNTGWYMNQRPFIIIVRPRLSMPANYGHYHGYPSNITSRIGDLSGYTEFSAVHLEGLTATSNELSELEKVLKGGIIIGN